MINLDYSRIIPNQATAGLKTRKPSSVLVDRTLQNPFLHLVMGAQRIRPTIHTSPIARKTASRIARCSDPHPLEKKLHSLITKAEDSTDDDSNAVDVALDLLNEKWDAKEESERKDRISRGYDVLGDFVYKSLREYLTHLKQRPAGERRIGEFVNAWVTETLSGSPEDVAEHGLWLKSIIDNTPAFS
jgi:hypothetical protein